jgi:hypothetical protein
MNVSKRKAERIGQKERTRQNLLSAARALVEEGETLTIARAAERANLAEATRIATTAIPEAYSAMPFRSTGRGSTTYSRR